MIKGEKRAETTTNKNPLGAYKPTVGSSYDLRIGSPLSTLPKHL